MEKTLTSNAASQPRKLTQAQLARLPPTGLLAAGGVLGALAASACCIAPLVLFGLGVSGAWIANLTALAPYQPVFIVSTLAFLATGFVMAYRRPKLACATEGTCARPISTRATKIALWAATLLIAAAIAFPYVTPLILDM